MVLVFLTFLLQSIFSYGNEIKYSDLIRRRIKKMYRKQIKIPPFFNNYVNFVIYMKMLFSHLILQSAKLDFLIPNMQIVFIQISDYEFD